MAKGLNKVTIMGNVVRDVELKQTGKGREYVRFSLAVGDDYKDKSGQAVKQTDFVNCTAWGSTASIISRYAVKGKPLLVEGKIKTDTYEKNGQKQYATYVLVSEVYLVYFGDQPRSEAPVDTSNEGDPDAFPFGDGEAGVY